MNPDQPTPEVPATTPTPEQMGPPPADTPEQVEERLNKALSDTELDARAREVAEQIVATQPEVTPTPEAPAAPATPVSSELPDMTPLTSQDLPPAAEVTTPFAPTREAVAAQEATQAATQARQEQIVTDSKEIMDRGVELGLLTPPVPEVTAETPAVDAPVVSQEAAPAVAAPAEAVTESVPTTEVEPQAPEPQA